MFFFFFLFPLCCCGHLWCISFSYILVDIVYIYNAGPAPVYYVPAPPPETIRGPRFISHPPHLAYPIPPLDPLALRANLLKQIEYYFR